MEIKRKNSLQICYNPLNCDCTKSSRGQVMIVDKVSRASVLTDGWTKARDGQKAGR